MATFSQPVRLAPMGRPHRLFMCCGQYHRH